ncbi:T9SS type A sorting domain-containing protein [Kaistella sp. DKR-2]|uniref:GEVED domain-containing protein n=1 Tax=Kaistella soli TaxID=2849654 RepID=UPI001C27D1DA|nr:GEVED domain-containing protein [Kaistella soli]MBU8882733.1 T9SS type A sorting domain-containing protein [Kaistella soli]
MEKKLLPGYGRILILALTLLLLASNNTFAQIALRGVSTANSNTGTLTINKPAGIVAGDLMIFNIAQRGIFTLSNPISAGWSPIAGADLVAGPFLFRWGALLYKIATAAEPANYSFTLDAQNNGATGAIVAFSGVDQVTPFDVPPGALSVQGTQLGIAASAKTTVTNNAAVVMFAMAAGSSPTYSGWSTTSPGTLAELYDNQNGGLSSVGAAWAIKAVAGGTGAGSATLNTAERNGGILLALRLVAPPTITSLGAPSGCVGSSLTITGTNLLGATAVAIGGTAAAITATTATSVTVTVGSGTTGTVQVTTPGGSATSAATFTVNPLPSPIGGGAATVCTGSDSPAFTNATAGGSWSVANGTGTATIDNSTGIVTGVTAGAVTVVYTVGSCSVSKALNVQQTPGAIGGGAAAVCVGASTPAFSNASIGGTWSVINGTGSATINNGTRTVTGVTAGTVTVVYTVGSCTPATYNLTVNPSPAAIGGGAATVCTGADSPAFTNATTGGIWSVTNGSGSATIDNSTGIVTGVTAGTVTVVYTIGSCSVSKALTVQQTPAAIGGGAATVCVGAATPAFNNASVGGTWSVINGTGSATINTVTRVVTGVTAGTVTVVYTVGSCTPATYNLTVNPSPAAIGGGAATVCTGADSPAFTDATAGGTWSVTNGTGAATIDNSTGIVTGVTAGAVTVVYTVGSCSVSKALTVQQTPGAIGGGAAAVCVGASTPAFSNASGGGTWSVINGTGSATINTVTRIVTGVTAGTVTVVYTVGTCAANYLLTVNATPVITAQPVATSICTTGSGTFSVTATGATAYQWRRAGVNLTNVAPYSGVNTSTLTITNPAAAIAGNFDVVVSNTNCSVTSATRALTVTAVPAVVTGPVPADNATGVCYTGSGPVTNSIGWGTAAGAISYDVYFGAGSVPASVTANVAANNYNTGALLPNTTYYWRVVAKNGCGDAATSATFSFTTSSVPCYCIPTVSNNYHQFNYIKQVSFLGNLTNPPINNSTFSTAPRGYQDFTGLPKATQAQGEGVNIFVDTQAAFGANFMKAWVDWNKNGVFETGEIVYQCTNAFINTTFGFTIPPATLPGDYRIRLRIEESGTGNNNFDACTTYNNVYSETEDYLFTVVANCDAKITSIANGSTCGAGTVTLNAVGTSGTKEYRWYTTPSGGSYTTSATSSWVTPSISTTTTYYVTAYNGTCESLFRTAVIATIKKVPTLTFSNNSPEVCGQTSTIDLTATASNEQIFLVDENFEGATISFVNNRLASPNGAITDWQVKASTYVPAYPTYPVWYPAISSGFGSNKFITSTSDLTAGGTTQGKVNEALELKTAVNTTGFVNLTLTFRMYFSSYYDSNNANTEGVFVETNSGAGWSVTPLRSYLGDEGIGTNFVTKTIDMSAYTNLNSLKIRIRYRAGWCDGVAIDDIKLFGEKPLIPSFSWTSTNPINFYSDAATTIPYIAGTPASVVYIKPTAVQLETYPDWNITATATLSNLCFASGNVVITNNGKIWNTLATDWSTPNWKPSTAVPASNQCVVIKTPVNVFTSTNALAKTLKIEPGGALTIHPDASVKVEDFFMNNATVDDVVVRSGGSLVQVADVPTLANAGSITAERSVNLTAGRQQYNFLISPVEDQNLKTVYPGIDYVLYYNEATGKFYASSGVYIKGRGLAVKEANATVSGSSVTGIFKGKPVNGAFSYGIVNSNTPDVNRGFNLTGNPYPSTIDLVTLYGLNNSVPGNLSSTFYFWDSTANSLTVQQGDAYGGEAYALFNAVSGTGTAATGDPGLAGTKIPTRYVSAGQGFMVKTNVAAMNLNFNNSIRTTNSAATDYFGKEQTKDRYWLNMKSPANITAHLAVVYFAGGNNGFAMDDSRSMLGSDAVYSIVENEKVAINGRSSFIITDTVPLGGTHFTAGNYTISLGDKEGVFASGQAVYLKDRQAGIITNLSEGSYTFAAVAGESTGRFEIIYSPETIMATDGSVKEELQVYRDGHEFVVKAQREPITDLEVFDTAGRLIYKIQPKSTKAVVDSNLMSNGVYVLKINQNGRITAKKILK